MDWVNIFQVLFALVSFLLACSDTSHPDKTTETCATHPYKVYVKTEEYAYETNKKFLSIAIPSRMFKNRWKYFNVSSGKLQNLAKGLAPAYLRIGGIGSIFLLFNPYKAYRRETPREHRMQSSTNFTVTPKDVDKIFTFAKENGLSIIFGLNVLLRDSNMHWSSTNSEKLMQYITDRDFSCAWELGNEPIELQTLTNWTITGKELAFDFKILRNLLNEHPEYGQMIFGPDVSAPWSKPIRIKFLKEFLTNIGGSIDGMTYHQYYTNNKANVSQFYDAELLDSLITQIQEVQRIMKESGASSISTWLGETSSAYDGGVPGVSDSYIAGFMWLDKLGVAARLKHDVVIRQTFYAGSYSLINKKTLDPLPDYWSSLLYKKLVGSRVLEVYDGLSLGRTIRVYAHCTSDRSTYDTGSVVLIALNTQHNEVQLVLTNELEKLLVHQYLLTPGENNNLTSQTVRLNGELLQMINDTQLPNIQPKPIIYPVKIILPPVSYGFFVIPDAQVEACQTAYGKVMT